MKLRDFLEKWGLSGLKLKLGFLEAEFSPRDADRAASWELYIELLTRIVSQPLQPDAGDEKTALESLHALFALTRDTLKRHGSGCTEFAKVAIPFLNQIVRPVTAKWHRLAVTGAFEEAANCMAFREELSALQRSLRAYTRALAEMAQVEDLTALEAE